MISQTSLLLGFFFSLPHSPTPCTTCKGADPSASLRRATSQRPSCTQTGRGTRGGRTPLSVQAAMQALQAHLDTIDPIRVVDRVDHAQNAANNTDLSLPPLEVLFFGNPRLGTPLMQENPLVGLDLPQRIAAFENADEQVLVTYTDPKYLQRRHGLQDSQALRTIENALRSIVETSTQADLTRARRARVRKGAGIVTRPCEGSVSDTVNRLKQAIENAQGPKILFELDHAQNAASVGLDLAPSTLVVFGAPQLGSQLMSEQPAIGLDLPQKMLVWQDEQGACKISYNDPHFVAWRYGLSRRLPVLAQISRALENFASLASGLED